MKMILTLAFIATVHLTAFAQDNHETDIKNKSTAPSYSYAYIMVQGKPFSKKLKVEVDLGNSPEQIIASKEYSEVLTNKKSISAILNYMGENQFDLVNTLENIIQGSNSGIVFIMRKKN